MTHPKINSDQPALGGPMPKTDQQHRPPDAPALCDSCKSYGPPALLEQRLVAGHEVTMCIDPRSCRRRAELAGIWAVYP